MCTNLLASESRQEMPFTYTATRRKPHWKRPSYTRVINLRRLYVAEWNAGHFVDATDVEWDASGRERKRDSGEFFSSTSDEREVIIYFNCSTKLSNTSWCRHWRRVLHAYNNNID